MRILVLSDTHRSVKAALKIAERHPDIQHIFFLGDVVSDIEAVKEKFPNRIYHIVSGNCDGLCRYKSYGIETVENIRIFYCHGHRQGVKFGLEKLKETAIENNCTLALFGHTHCSLLSYDDGLYIVNPGSASFPRDGSKPSYAIIDITKSGIMPSLMNV